jgi:YHS domain-containing protein
LTQPFPLAYDVTRTGGTNRVFSRMMRFLIWLVVLCWTVAMLRRAVAWVLHGFSGSATNQPSQPGPANQQPSASSRRLVRDPVCGMHVAEERAIPLKVEGELLHFCSQACRDQYARDNQKFAAHG